MKYKDNFDQYMRNLMTVPDQMHGCCWKYQNNLLSMPIIYWLYKSLVIKENQYYNTFWSFSSRNINSVFLPWSKIICKISD